jgi:GTP-binding protein Era
MAEEAARGPGDAVEGSFRAGFAAIVGKPNVGKSTLMNTYLGQKIAIVSPKPQTTRNVIRGALTLPDAQIIFLDTPGIHKPIHKLGEYMVAAASRTISDADVVVFVADLSHPPTREDGLIADLIREECTVPVILALNKADTVKDPDSAGRPYEALLRSEDGDTLAKAVLLVSATTGAGRDELLQAIIAHLPESPAYYPEDFLTDQPLRIIAGELVREQILRFVRQEIPHATAVIVEEFKERNPQLTYISAYIYVEKDSQKQIMLGKGGRMLKRIGQAARLEIEAFLQTRVYLELWVKVRKNWRKKQGALRWLGYDVSRLS